jgi:hypothetical protein
VEVTYSVYPSCIQMGEEREGLFHQIVHIFRSVTKTKEEVKTPLSFFFRAVLMLPVLIVPFLVSTSVPANIRYEALLLGLAMLLALILMVGIFAWVKPKNLVYGETGHRAEFRMEYGTEKRIITHHESMTLPGEANPKSLPQKIEEHTGEGA